MNISTRYSSQLMSDQSNLLMVRRVKDHLLMLDWLLIEIKKTFRRFQQFYCLAIQIKESKTSTLNQAFKNGTYLYWVRSQSKWHKLTSHHIPEVVQEGFHLWAALSNQE